MCVAPVRGSRRRRLCARSLSGPPLTRDDADRGGGRRDPGRRGDLEKMFLAAAPARSRSPFGRVLDPTDTVSPSDPTEDRWVDIDLPEEGVELPPVL